MLGFSGVHLRVVNGVGDEEGRIPFVIGTELGRRRRIPVEIEQFEPVQREFEPVPHVPDPVRICSYVFYKPVFAFISFRPAPQLPRPRIRAPRPGVRVRLARAQQEMINKIIPDAVPVQRLFHDSVTSVDLIFLAVPEGSVTSSSWRTLSMTAIPVGSGGLSYQDEHVFQGQRFKPVFSTFRLDYYLVVNFIVGVRPLSL